MSAFPQPFLDPPIVITPFSLESLGTYIFQTVGTTIHDVSTNFLSWAAGGSAALYIPFFLSKTIQVNLMWIKNGTTIGNVDVGIYDSSGTRLVSFGGTPHTGNTAIQTFTLTPTEIGPGQFYMALVFDDSTTTLAQYATTNSFAKLAGIAKTSTSYPLPAKVTLGSYNSSRVPLIGLSVNTSL